jgi:hypothetical protein
MGFLDFLFPKVLTRRQLTSVDDRKIRDEWGEIEDLVKIGKPSALKEAVVKADKLMDYALIKIVDGVTMGERLKNAKERFSYEGYDKVWKAHKVRNAIAHEIDYDPPHFITKEAVENFRVSFSDLGINL